MIHNNHSQPDPTFPSTRMVTGLMVLSLSLITEELVVLAFSSCWRMVSKEMMEERSIVPGREPKP